MITASPDSIAVNVRFFARLREALGTDSEAVTLSAGSTTADLIDTLARRGEAWQQLQQGGPVLVAVNQQMGRTGTPLQDGDEVALFPPVTGG